MKKLTLTAVLAMMLCLLLIFSGCANSNCDESKLQNYVTDDITLAIGETASLPTSGDDLVVTLSKEGIVAVENGTIRALAAGNVQVTARLECLEQVIDVTVVDNTRSVTVNNGAGGSISGVESGSYPVGTKLNVTITADAFNYIPTLKVNDKVVELKIATPVYTAEVTVEEDTTISVTYYDYTKRGDNAVLSARRDLVEAESTRMATTLFMYDKNLGYSSASEDFSKLNLKADTYYAGIPYTSGCQSINAYLTNVAYTDEYGVNHMDTSAYIGPRWGFLLGASCADMAYWAQAQVSDTISYSYAANMTETTGLYKVGDYIYTTRIDSEGRVVLADSKADCTTNGDQKMFEAYALLQKGDVATSWDEDFNHAIVIVGVHVERNSNGTINGTGSYITFDDLNGNYGRSYTTTVNGKTITALTACRNDYTWTFNQIFNDGYLPMTCKELLTPEDPVGATVITDSEAGNLSFDTLIKGQLESNYYFSHAVMEIKDAQDNTVQKATRFGRESDYRDRSLTHCDFSVSYFAERHNFAWSTSTSEMYALYSEDNMINPTILESGNYHCTLTAYMSNGDVMVVRDFDFSV